MNYGSEALDTVEQLGLILKDQNKAATLLKHFGSIANLARASVQDLSLSYQHKPTSVPPMRFPLRDLAAHQYSWKGHAWPQLDINWPYLLETSRPVEALSIQCREGVELTYAE